MKTEKKYGLIVFCVPAFVPAVLHLIFLFDFDASSLNKIFYNNIEIFKMAFETKSANEVLVWGYLFSIIYLALILPFMALRTNRTIYMGGENRNKMKSIWLLLAIVLFAIFFFLNFIDFSSGSRKYAEVIKLSFYFWPLFYFYFLFPLYLGFMLFLAFVNTEIK